MQAHTIIHIRGPLVDRFSNHIQNETILAFKVGWQQRLLVSEETQETHERDQRLSMSKPVNGSKGQVLILTREFFHLLHRWKYTVCCSPRMKECCSVWDITYLLDVDVTPSNSLPKCQSIITFTHSTTSLKILLLSNTQQEKMGLVPSTIPLWLRSRKHIPHIK